MKLILTLTLASTLQAVSLSAPVNATPAVVVSTPSSVGDEVSIGQAGNPYKCVIWRLSDKKKYQKYCK